MEPPTSPFVLFFFFFFPGVTKAAGLLSTQGAQSPGDSDPLAPGVRGLLLLNRPVSSHPRRDPLREVDPKTLPPFPDEFLKPRGT